MSWSDALMLVLITMAGCKVIESLLTYITDRWDNEA